MYYTYIIYSSKIGKYYTGQTMDLERRLEEHNRGKTHFLANGTPWEIKFSKDHVSRSDAMKLEKYIKKRGAERFLNDQRNQSG